MSEQNLKRKTAGALLWNLLDRVVQQILVFVVGIIVANILDVEDYSLVGMLALFTAISTILLDSGFSTALIQKKEPTETDYCSVFWFNIATGTALYLLLLACSPLIALFYGQPRLAGLSAVIFLSLPVNALGSIQTTLLTREVRFSELAKINVMSMSVSSLLALAMAYGGLGVWTLAVQPVALATVRALLLWVHGQWRPRFLFSMEAIKRLFCFASALLASNLLNTLFLNVYTVIIGKIYPLKQLGYYSQGSKMSDMGINLLYSSIQTATFPIFSSIQDDVERLLRAFRKTVRFTAFVAFPAMAGLVVIARPLIELLLKEKWWPAIPFFQLLCIGGLFTILTAVNNNFIKVKGHTGILLRMEYVKIALTVVALLLTFSQPVLVMVVGIVLTRLIVYVICLIYSSRYAGYPVGKQLKDTVPYAILSLIMAIAVWACSLLIDNNLLLVIVQLLAGAGVYLLSAHLSGSKIMKESLELLWRRK